MRTSRQIAPYALAVSFLAHLAVLLIYLPVPPPLLLVNLPREVRIVNAMVMSPPAVAVTNAEPVPLPVVPVALPPISPVEPPLVDTAETTSIEPAEQLPAELAGLSSPDPQPAESAVSDAATVEPAVSPKPPASQPVPVAAQSPVVEAPKAETIEAAPSGALSGGSAEPAVRPSPEASPAQEGVFIPLYQVDRKPERVMAVQPVYPPQAMRGNIEGIVILEADIDEEGRIADVRIIKKAGFGFDEAAAESIRKSTFSPAYVGDRPVSVRLRLTVKFSLED